MLEAHTNRVWNTHLVRLMEQDEAGGWKPVVDGWWNHAAARMTVLASTGEEIPYIMLDTASRAKSLAPADLIRAWQNAATGPSDPIKIRQLKLNEAGQPYFDIDHDDAAWRYLQVSVCR